MSRKKAEAQETLRLKRNDRCRQYHIKNRRSILLRHKKWSQAHRRERAAYRKRIRVENPQRSREQVSNLQAKKRSFLWGIKYNPCVDCNAIFPPVAMDFDHINSRISSLSTIHRGYDQLIDEIEKCQLVCANCHRVRTWKRLHGYLLSVKNSDLWGIQ